MAIVQSKQGSSATSPLTITLTSPTTAGNSLVVTLSKAGTTSNATLGAVTLGGSADHFGTSPAATAGSASSAGIVEMWLDQNCAGGQTSVACTFSGGAGTQAIMAIVEERDDLLASALDKTSPNAPGSSSLSWTSNATAATSQASEVLAGAAHMLSLTTAPTITGPSAPWANAAQISQAMGSTPVALLHGSQVVSAIGTATYSGTVSPASFSTVLVVTLKAAAVAAGATAQPLVATGPARPQRGFAAVLRSSLADDPVLTTRPPVLAVRPVPVPVVPRTAVLRSSLADAAAPPAAAGVQPLSAVSQARPGAGQTAVLRSTLADPPVLTTPDPVLAVPPAAVPQVPRPLLLRSSLADVAVTPAATPQPLLAVQAAAARPVPPVTLSRSSLADAAAAAAATPLPVVVIPAPPQARTWPQLILRGTLADPPVLTTPGPLMAVARYTPTRALALAGRSSLIDAPPPPAVLNATSAATVTSQRASASTVTAARTSAAALTSLRDSTSNVTAARTSAAAVTARSTSASSVSDG